MTSQYIRAGGALDILTKPELDDSMGHHFDAAIRDLLRGVDYLQFAGSAGNVNTFSIPWTPESGYTWAVKLVSAQLSGAGVLSVYSGSNTNVAPIGSETAITNGPNVEAVITWSSNVAVLKDSRQITLFCSGATISNYLIMVKQVPTEMQGKL
jgi:hypothetical protein